MPSKFVTRLGAFPQLAMMAPVSTIANLNITLSGHQIIDQVQTVDNMRVLVAGQADATQNGIWIADSTDWVRAPDWNLNDTITRGAMIVNTNRSAGWMIEYTGTFLLDTTEVSFILIYGTITIAAGAENDFDPGYSLTFVSTTSFTVDGFDVVNLYYVGRRIKLISQFGVRSYGEVVTSVFGTDTTVTLTMEGTDEVPNPLSNAILTTSDIQWVPISPNNHPFITMAKAHIVSGRIGADDWWVIVGSAGFIATSNDLGANWTKRTPTGGLTTEDINDITYDFDNERFMACADGGYIITSLDGINWVSSIPTDISGDVTSGDGHLKHIAYGNTETGGLPGFAVMGTITNAVNNAIYSSINNGVNWTSEIANLVNAAGQRFLRWNAGNGRYFVNNAATQTTSIQPAGTWSSSNEDSGAGHSHDMTFNIFDSTPDDRGLTVSLSGVVRYGSAGGTGQYFDAVSSGEVFGTSNLLCIVYSVLLKRYVAAGFDGKIGYAERDTHSTWALVANGFNPTSQILDIAYDENDAIFIAISNDGNICRSTNGIS